jgi:MoaA/NifB/PqqE/SkfB family radical SAM enzyme
MTLALTSRPEPDDARIDPIDRWRTAMRLAPADAADQLRMAFRETLPTQGELIFTGACRFQCAHCIYPPEFARLNRGLGLVAWDRILRDLYRGLGISTFVYGGRSLTPDGVEAMTRLRQMLPEAFIGLIDNGISMLPRRDALVGVEADWIDISLDGQPADHDRQRCVPGSFDEGLAGALWLKRNAVSPKVNILTCLTTINHLSVVEMIRSLNARGFKNFFITPITTVPGVGPSRDLELDDEQLCRFISSLRQALGELDDAWVEMNIFAAQYAGYIAQLLPDVWTNMRLERDGLSYHEHAGGKAPDAGNELAIRYFPSSLTGTREFIVNTNGDAILPKAMVYGSVEPRFVLGNLVRQNAEEIVRAFPESSCFDFQIREFIEEQAILGRYF